MSSRLRCFALALCLGLLVPSLYAQHHTAASADPDLSELQNYTLTMDKVTRLMQTIGDFGKLAKSDPSLGSALENDADKHESIADMERRISAHPQIVSVIKDHGFTTHEFVVAELTLFQSAFAAAAKQSGADPAKLASDAHVNPANITFMEQHKEDFEELQKKYGAKQGDSD